LPTGESGDTLTVRNGDIRIQLQCLVASIDQGFCTVSDHLGAVGGVGPPVANGPCELGNDRSESWWGHNDPFVVERRGR